MSKTMDRIHETGLVPVVVIDDASKAAATGKAMAQGGVDIMEITMRTPAGLDAIKSVARDCPDILVGAGTVLTMEQCEKSIENGARFIVSPGFNPEIVEYCVKNGVDVCPGCVTPTEIDMGMRAGLRVLKFFPANIYGGLKAIKALAGPFGGVQFIPTGGVSLSNLSDFVDPPIYAIGGGWLCERGSIRDGNWDSITKVCKDSVDVLLGLQSGGKSLTLDELMEKGGSAATHSIRRSVSQLTRRGFACASSTETEASLSAGGVKIHLTKE